MDLYRQPLRTFLTLSGVSWGTFAIVLLLAFGVGVREASMKAMHGMGQNLILAFPGTTTKAYKGFIKGKPVRITPEEVLELKEILPDIGSISPEMMNTRRIRYAKGSEEYNNTIRGVNVEYGKMRNCIPEKGRFLDELDINLRRRVCFMGDTIAKNLFHDEDPVGKKVTVEGIPFTVIGVMVKKIQTSNYSGQQDEHCLFIPYTTFRSLFGAKYVDCFILQPRSAGIGPGLIKQIRNYLGEKTGFAPDDVDAVFILDFSEFERSLDMFFVAFNIFLAIIGSFTLLVGGVGVASIMLVVVEERIREIGIKLAVGAKRKLILWQFFSETLVIIFLGGLIGFFFAALLLGVLPAKLIEEYVGNPHIDWVVGAATIFILLIIGTASGMMPARKAASTDPIQALRH